MHRLGIVVIGQGVANNEYRLFRKLRPQGTYFTHVKHENGVATLLEAAAKRAAAHPAPFAPLVYRRRHAGHAGSAGLTLVSWASLSPVRAAVQSRMQKTL